MRRKINPAERRHQDYLRRKGLKVGHDYELKLTRLRNAEVARVMKLCRENYDDPQSWDAVIEARVTEEYLPGWMRGLYVGAGLPHAASVTRDLTRGKAAAPVSDWERAIVGYADSRIADQVVTLTGTMKGVLRQILKGLLTDDTDMGVEKLAQAVYRTFKGEYAEWMARRVAQTETMIALGEAGDAAARTLDVGFVKQWCISGVGNTRESHEAMDGVMVGQDDLFELEDCTMRFPHDTSTGAPPEEIINCACSVIRIPM